MRLFPTLQYWMLRKGLLKTLLLINFTACFLCAVCQSTSAKGVSQQVNISEKDVPLVKLFDEINRQTGYTFVYTESLLTKGKRVNIVLRNSSLEQALDICFKDQPITYTIMDKLVVIKDKDRSELNEQSYTSIPPIEIRGKVTDGAGKPIQGVSVLIAGTTKGTTTDNDGTYVLSVSSTENIVLEFTNVGYQKRTMAVGKQTQINITLESLVSDLNDIVVVGYGTQKKVTLSGAVVSTSGNEIRQSPATNLSNSLVGRLPGLSGVTRSGEPGSDQTSLLIRGSNTLGDNSPLVVVDGIAGRDFTRLNPADIEAVTVLKDASAAIYGARAANGVILVTTKRGKSGKARISLNLNAGFQQPTVLPAMADAAQYTSMLNELAYYNNPTLGRNQKYSADDIQKYTDGSDPWGHPNTDWFNSVFRPWSSIYNGNVSVSGGTENVKYFLSVGVRTQDGVYENSGTKFTEYNFRSNIDAKINKNISFALDFAGSQENRDYAVNGVGSIFRSIFRGKPNTPAYWPNGTPGPSFLEFGDQPVVTSTKANGYNLDKWYRLQSNARLNINIPWIPGLSLQGNISVDKTIENQKVFQKPWYLYTWDGNADHITVPGQVGLASPQLTQNISDGQQITMNGFLTYEKSIHEKHNIKFMVGSEKQTGGAGTVSAHRQNYLSGAIDQLFAGAADQYMTNTGTESQTARLNYFGRVNYDYVGKYLLEFVWREDGSYIFPADKRFGFFPGISGGWRVSQEDFWKKNVGFIDELKVRASWGQTGNDRIAPFQYISTYGFSGNYVYNTSNLVNNLIEARIPNPNVTWEVANQTNIGFDAGLLHNKLLVSFDYFHNVRSNILWQRNASIPVSAGLTLPPENIGKVDNKGWEGIVTYRDRVSEFNYSVSASGSFQKNKIVFWDETPGVPDYQKSTGQPMGSQLYYVATGIFSDQAAIDKYPHWSGARPGDVIFQDVNGDGKIDGLDMVRNTKNDLPTFTGAFTLNLQYKQFDLAVLVQGASGSSKYITIEGGNTGNAYKLWADNRWTPEHPNTSYTRAWDYKVPYWDNQPNTYWLYSSDYVRLKNVELGYSLSAKATQKVGIEALRIYANGLNLLTMSKLSKDKLMDPEAAYNYSYPLQRLLNVGLTLTF